MMDAPQLFDPPPVAGVDRETQLGRLFADSETVRVMGAWAEALRGYSEADRPEAAAPEAPSASATRAPTRPPAADLPDLYGDAFRVAKAMEREPDSSAKVRTCGSCAAGDCTGHHGGVWRRADGSAPVVCHCPRCNPGGRHDERERAISAKHRARARRADTRVGHLIRTADGVSGIVVGLVPDGAVTYTGRDEPGGHVHRTVPWADIRGIIGPATADRANIALHAIARRHGTPPAFVSTEPGGSIPAGGPWPTPELPDDLEAAAAQDSPANPANVKTTPTRADDEFTGQLF